MSWEDFVKCALLGFSCGYTLGFLFWCFRRIFQSVQKMFVPPSQL